jgi:hypothetical protein
LRTLGQSASEWRLESTSERGAPEAGSGVQVVMDPTAGEQRLLFGTPERRPLTAMPGRDDDRQLSLPLDDASDMQRGAA